MYYVYIIKSKKNDKLYIGYTNDLKRRFQEHNEGKSTYTKKFTPWTLMCYEAYLSSEDARERERQLKHHGKAWSQLKRKINHSVKN